MKQYPIPIHMECKSSSGKLRPSQKEQRQRILKSGSIFIVVDRPSQLYDFFIDHGFNKHKIEFTDHERRLKWYKESEVKSFAKSYLKIMEKIYGIYWVINVQNIGSQLGRPDLYFEIPIINQIEAGGGNE